MTSIILDNEGLGSVRAKLNELIQSGGGGTPGGSNGQLQYNNSGAFGGLTMGGDATIDTLTGLLTIALAVITNAKLAEMAANTVKANASALSASPTDVALDVSQLLGRGSTGDITAITLGTNLTMTGSVLSASGGGSTTTGLLMARTQGLGAY